MCPAKIGQGRVTAKRDFETRVEHVPSAPSGEMYFYNFQRILDLRGVTRIIQILMWLAVVWTGNSKTEKENAKMNFFQVLDGTSFFEEKGTGQSLLTTQRVTTFSSSPEHVHHSQVVDLKHSKFWAQRNRQCHRVLQTTHCDCGT